MIFAYVCAAFVFVIGFFTIIVLSIEEAYQFFKRRKAQNDFKMSRPQLVDDSRLCDIHTWIEVPSLNEENEHVDIQMCGVCGIIPTRNSMLSPKEVERINKQMKAMAIESKILADFSDLEEEEIRKLFADELAAGLDIKKLILVYTSGQNIRDRFILYRLAKLEELEVRTSNE